MLDEPVIVFVDDEDNVLKSLERLFFDTNHQIHTFNSPKNALNEIPNLDADIIVSDQMMPEMMGIEFLEKAFELSPTSNFMMLTAFPEYGLVARALNEADICHFLTKPWDPDEFVKLTENIMAKRRQEMSLMDEISSMKLSNEQKRERVEQLKNQVKNRVQIILGKNKELFSSIKALEQNLWDTIRIFFSLVENKSPEVGEHCVRVSKLALFFGRKMKLSEDELTTLEIASLLHDVGKIALPEYLLERSTTSLSKDEEDLLAMHPLTGQFSFSNIEPLQKIGNIIRHHHERWNGKGFPDKLQTTEIELLTRMLSICNKYDNLFYNQYKYHPTKKEKVLNRLITEAGAVLDPNLVKLFVSYIAEINELEEMEKNSDKVRTFSPVKLLDVTLEKLYNEIERIRDGSIKVIKETENIPNIICFPIKLRDMFHSLILNSIEAIPSRGNIIVKMIVADGCLKVSVSDDGLGIDKKNLERIFMPGYTTKDSRKHEGMGLVRFYEGLKAHEARLELTSDPGRGTKFTFHIPLS